MFLNMANPTLQCSHTFAQLMDQHGVDYIRITLRFSITTIFQMVLLLRSPEGMQHTMRLHRTVMTCPTIVGCITFRLMPLIPSCKLIIIHPLFVLSTWIAVIASYTITPITFVRPSGFLVSTVATPLLLANPHLCQVPSHDTVALSQSRPTQLAGWLSHSLSCMNLSHIMQIMSYTHRQEVSMSFFLQILCSVHVSQKALSMCIVSSSANICHFKTHVNKTIFARPMVDPVASYPVCWHVGQENCCTKSASWCASNNIIAFKNGCHSGEGSL